MIPILAFVRNYGNQCVDVKGEAQVAETTRREYRCETTGADQLVRARKAGNAAGAKELNQVETLLVQLETGGNL